MQNVPAADYQVYVLEVASSSAGPDVIADMVPPVDEVYLALGTTIKVAGSQGAFRAVDFDANLAVARAALASGARRCGLVSAMGANASSRIFYNRVKGELEAVYRFTGGVKERAGSGSDISSPRNVYRCRDGTFVAVSGSTQAMAIGRAEMIDDTRFCTNAARVKHRIQVDEAVGACAASMWRKNSRRGSSQI